MITSLSGKIGSGKDTFAKMLKIAIAEAMTPDTWLSHHKNMWEVSDDTLTKWSGYQTKRWAGTLKEIVAILIGCTVEQLEDRDFKESQLGPEWNKETGMDGMFPEPIIKKYTVRQLLQEVGTNAMRDVIHPNVWVNALMSQYKPYIKGLPQLTKSNGQDLIEGTKYGMGKAVLPNWIITDTRFPNECEAVKKRNGLLIRLERDLIVQGKVVPLCHSHSSETALNDYKFDEVVHNNGTLNELYEQAKLIVTKHKFHESNNVIAGY